MAVTTVGVRAYFSFVVLVGLALVVAGLRGTDWVGHGIDVVSLVLLLVLANSGFGSVRLSENQAPVVSVVGPISLAAVLLLPPVSVPLVTAWAMPWRDTSWRARAFNMGMTAIMGGTSAWTYHLLHGQQLTGPEAFRVASVVLPFLASALVCEMTNGLLLVGYLSLSERISPWRVWYGALAQSAWPMFLYSIFGLMLAVAWSYVGPIAAVLVLAPLVVARWVFAEFSVRQEAYERTMRALIQAVETKDYYTRGHSERVSRASVMIGRQSGMREDRVDTLRYAGMLHDVGKLGVPTDVLQASGRLTDEQYEAIQMHPVRGREITKDLAFLGEAIDGIYFHHERLDGRGYPLGLKGEEIPEFARIIAVADAFDSMTTTRSYRGARSVEAAVEELLRCKGTQFDPAMVDALVAAVDAQGWETVDTSIPVPPASDVPSLGRDDDDPSVAAALDRLAPGGAVAAVTGTDRAAEPLDASQESDPQVTPTVNLLENIEI